MGQGKDSLSEQELVRIEHQIELALKEGRLNPIQVRDRIEDCFVAIYLLRHRQGKMVIEIPDPADKRRIVTEVGDIALVVGEIRKRFRDFFAYLGSSWEKPTRQSLATIVAQLSDLWFGARDISQVKGDPLLTQHFNTCQALLERLGPEGGGSGSPEEKGEAGRESGSAKLRRG